MLLGVISLSIIGYIIKEGFININSWQKKGLLFFVGGVIINEILLMLQGVAGILYIFIPFVNESLFVAALVMFTGLSLFIYKTKFIRQKNRSTINTIIFKS